jgi:hypothetical protein
MNEIHRAETRLVDKISAAPHHPEHYMSRAGDYIFAVLLPAIPLVSVVVILVCWKAMIP